MTAPAPRGRAAWAWWALACSPALALELGEIETLSALGQPIQAEIPAGKQTLDDVRGHRLRVAGAQAYAAAGRDRPAFLDSVTLGWLQRNDELFVDVSSRLRANEPLFELMLEIDVGSTTTIRRGYTVLLDLPDDVPAAVAERLPELVDLPPAAFVLLGAPPAPAAPPKAAATVPGWLDVQRGQTLSGLARSLRPDGPVSLYRVLLSLFRANPDAFVNGDMSRLKAGARLRVPDLDEISRLTADPPQPGDPNVGGPKRRWPPRKLAISPSLAAVPVSARELQVQPAVTMPRAPSKPRGSMHISPQLGSVERQADPAGRAPPEPQNRPIVEAQPARAAAEVPRVPASLVAAAPPAGTVVQAAPGAAAAIPDPPTPAAESPATAPSAPTPSAEPGSPEPPAESTAAPPEAAALPAPASADAARFVTLAALALLALAAAVVALLFWRRRRKAAAAAPSALAGPAPVARPAARMAVAQPTRPIHPSQVVVDDHAPSAGTPAGFYAEIAGLLESSLERAPIRHDLRLKLLEMYHAAGMAPAFLKHARAYHGKPGPRDPGWAEIERMGRELAPEDPLFGGGRGPAVPRQQRFYEGLDAAALAAALDTLESDYQRARADAGYRQARDRFFADHAGRPTPIVVATASGNSRLFLKLERADHARDDQLLNALGQVHLAKHRGCTGVVVGSLDGSHGIAAAVAARHAGLACTVIMGPVAMREYAARAAEMRDLGAEVIESGADPRHAEDPRRAAMRRWLDDPARLQFINGLSAGPPPFPSIVRDLQSVIGEELRAQLVAELGGMPAAVVANAAEGHAAVGTLAGFLAQPGVRLLCVESGVKNAERRPLQREHGWLKSTGRVEYVAWDNMDEAMSVIDEFSIIHSMNLSAESACAVASARQIAGQMPEGSAIGVLVVAS